MISIHRFLSRFSLYRRLAGFLKVITLPGFERVPVYSVISFFIKEVVKEELNVRGTSLAFNFFMALFPSAIFFFTFVAYLPIDNSHEAILQFFSDILPKSAYVSIESTLEDILKHQRGSLLSFSMLMALYFGTNGIHSMMNAFNKYTRDEEERSFLKQRLVSTGLAMLISATVVVAVGLITSGEWLLQKMLVWGIFGNKTSIALLTVIKWLVVLFLFFTMISSLYYWGPSKTKKWRFFSPGSTLATILSIVTTLGFAFYVNNFNSYNKLYGSIGTLIVVMLLIYFNCMILLIGFELNASIDKGLEKKLKRPIPRFNDFLNATEDLEEKSE